MVEMVKRVKFRRGFTLIEVLITVSIIAVLAAIGLATYTGAQKRSRDARRMADLEAVRSALELYRADINAYPIATSAPTNAQYLTLGATLALYITPLPSDPGTTLYTYGSTGASGSTYSLCATREILTPASYCLNPP